MAEPPELQKYSGRFLYWISDLLERYEQMTFEDYLDRTDFL